MRLEPIARWQRLARRPLMAVSAISGGTFACALLLTWAAGIPEAHFHDESAMLVMADVFAQGRVCEVPHPFWPHFETFHVLSQPCYQGKYPPGPALLLAMGQVLTGYPIAGVWLSVMLMIGAIGYALYAWLPPQWALFGVAIAALRFGIATDWSHSYWGGAIAAAGGGLVIGAAGRLTKRAYALDGVLLGLGLVALAMSRPYEGLAYSLVPLALVGHAALRRWPGRRPLWRVALPATAAVLAIGAAWLAYYNNRITGSPITPAYLAYERTYSGAPLFVGQEPRATPDLSRHSAMQTFETDFALRGALEAQKSWPWHGLRTLARLFGSYLHPALMVAALGVLLTEERRRAGIAPGAIRVAVLSLGIIFAACSLQLWFAPHYLSPMMTSVLLLAAAGAATLSQWRMGRLDGRIVIAVVVAMLMVRVGVDARRAITSIDWWMNKRAVRERLLATAGDDLVFVRYGPAHIPHFEWVYNGAAIDEQPIVWAREIDPRSDAALRDYFSPRKAWIVEADPPVVRLMPWTPSG